MGGSFVGFWISPLQNLIPLFARLYSLSPTILGLMLIVKVYKTPSTIHGQARDEHIDRTGHLFHDVFSFIGVQVGKDWLFVDELDNLFG